MKTKIHAAAGGLAFLIITLFWLASILSETLGGPADIVQAKTFILIGMTALIPALIITGATGFSLGRNWKSPLIAAKLKRMRLIGLNGLLILLPSAIALAIMARSGSFGTGFYAVQGLELLAGAVNLVLIGTNIKAGLAISARQNR